MTDLYAAWVAGSATAAASAPHAPLSKADLKKELRPLVAEQLAGIRMQVASMTERIEFLEAQRAAWAAKLGGGRG